MVSDTHLLQQLLKKLVNTRAKNKKTQNIRKSCSHASIEEFNQQWNESGDLIGSNDDLLTEILLRLPALSIIRFKMVSKHWLSLLSHKSFTLRYDKLLKSPGIFGYVGRRDGGYVYVPFDIENRSTPPARRFRDYIEYGKGSTGHLFHSLRYCLDPADYIIEKSCNGLLLCGCVNYDVFRGFKYFVFNPTTRQFAIIPPLLGGHVGNMNLAYHQTECVHYKIVCVCAPDPKSGLFQIQMYSSDTRIWKICVEAFQANHSSIWTFSKGVYWNGAIHWALSYNNQLYFDIISERLQTCPSPEDILSGKTLYLGESRGHLHLVDVFNYTSLVSSALDVYEMLSDRSGWFHKYQVKLHELTNAFLDINDYVYGVMDLVRGKNEEDTFLVLSIPGKIIRYNIHDKSSKHICNGPDKRLYNYDWYIHRYMETLTSF